MYPQYAYTRYTDITSDSRIELKLYVDATINTSLHKDTAKGYLQVPFLDQVPCNKRMGKCTVKYSGTLLASLLHQVDTANLSKFQKHSSLSYLCES